MIPVVDRGGFTVLELLVGLLMVALVVAVCVPQLVRHMQLVQLDGAARSLAAEMMRARYAGIIQNCRCRFHVDAASGCYWWEEDRNLNRVLDPGETVVPSRTLPGGVRFDCRGVLGPPYDPRRPPPGPVTFTGGWLNAGPDGRWASPGTVYLANDWGDHAAVSVAISGRVRVWLWDADRQLWE
jgi:type II secretory pathway pseudopilin PulG